MGRDDPLFDDDEGGDPLSSSSRFSFSCDSLKMGFFIDRDKDDE